MSGTNPNAENRKQNAENLTTAIHHMTANHYDQEGELHSREEVFIRETAYDFDLKRRDPVHLMQFWAHDQDGSYC